MKLITIFPLFQDNIMQNYFQSKYTLLCHENVEILFKFCDEHSMYSSLSKL